MTSGFYGNDINLYLPIDKIYPNYSTAQDSASSDEIFLGRYVLINYNFKNGVQTDDFNIYTENKNADKGFYHLDILRKSLNSDGIPYYATVGSLNLSKLANPGESVIDFNRDGLDPEYASEKGIDTHYNGIRLNVQLDTENPNVTQTAIFTLNIPELGNAISDMWDIVFEREEGKIQRKINLDRVPSETDRKENRSEKLNTLAGCLNHCADLLGYHCFYTSLDGTKNDAKEYSKGKKTSYYWDLSKGIVYKYYDQAETTMFTIDDKTGNVQGKSANGLLSVICEMIYSCDNQITAIENRGNAIANTLENLLQGKSGRGIDVGSVGFSEGGVQGEVFNSYAGSALPNIASKSGSHAEGLNTQATAARAHAEGYGTIASGQNSHTEGYCTHASGIGAHAEGIGVGVDSESGSSQSANTAFGAINRASHAEGERTLASGTASHAEGSGTTASGNDSHAEGSGTIASKNYSHAEGWTTTASGESSHAEGTETKASGNDSHAEGTRTEASGNSSHAEGADTKALKSYSHAEGYWTVADGIASHAEGGETQSNGDYSHAEGDGSQANGVASHAEGTSTNAEGESSHSEGYKTKATGIRSHAEGGESQAIGESSHAEGGSCKANGSGSHAEGWGSEAEGTGAHAEGKGTIAKGNDSLSGDGAHAEGSGTQAYGEGAHAEGYSTLAQGNNAHAEGNGTQATNNNTHAEGYQTIASGLRAHAEGSNTTASGSYSHAEGYKTKVCPYPEVSVAGTTLLGECAHAEGFSTISYGNNSHSEGSYCVAIGLNSHAEGGGTSAEGTNSHAEGSRVIAYGNYSHAEGGSSYSLQYGAYGDYSHSEGYDTRAEGAYSHSEGHSTQATGNASHAEGYNTTASHSQAHAEGSTTTASNANAHAEGFFTTASGLQSHAEGSATTASNANAHAEGMSTIASGANSHAGGNNTQATGKNSFTHGQGLYARGNQVVFGYYNSGGLSNTPGTGHTGTDSPTKDPQVSLFMIGNGDENDGSNAFRVRADGYVASSNGYSGTGADFAEYFEWEDGNILEEDRRGLFVTLKEDKICLANLNDEYVLGAITSNEVLVGNSASENWQNKYLTDIFGKVLTEEIKVAEHFNEETEEITPENTIIQWKINPDYNPEQEYIPREFRKEWSPVGLCGQVVIVDDGTCEVNGYCYPGQNGVGTKSDKGYRVMKRLDDTHIKVLIK